MSSERAGRAKRPLEAHVVAVVDDDLFMLRAMGRALSGAGYRTLLFDNPWTALSGLPAASVDVVILDRNMPHCSGPDLARRLREGFGDDPPMLVLFSSDLAGLLDGDRALFDLVLSKSVRPDELLLSIGPGAARTSATWRRPRFEARTDTKDTQP